MTDRTFELFERYYARTVHYLIAQFGFARPDAEDLAQDAFLRVLKSNEAFRGGAEWAFIRTTAHNVAVNWIRDRKAAKRRGVSVSIDDLGEFRDGARGADDALVRREETNAIRKRLLHAIAALPEGARLCYFLRRRGRSYDEISVILGITIDAVKTRLHNAKRRLHEAVGKLPEGVDWADLAEEETTDDER
ncbi:MAG TPA: RNA polymerase sigma factor [Thermoanaerobaculia bacterium]|nr:RNA polymerase sigma factor [Thermoanaerobaculia bacterium]